MHVLNVFLLYYVLQNFEDMILSINFRMLVVLESINTVVGIFYQVLAVSKLTNKTFQRWNFLGE